MANRIVLDISEMAAEINMTPHQVLENMEIRKGGWRLAFALKVCRNRTHGDGFGRMQNFAYLAAHFVKAETED